MLVMRAHHVLASSKPKAAIFLALFALITIISLSFSTFVSAHATLVLGTITTRPSPTQPGKPIELTLKLLDLTQIPVEDAFVIAEFRHSALREPVTALFEASGTPGVYTAKLTLPGRGTYQLLLRDQTYRQEEAQAQLDFVVGERTPQPLEFVFPPTATGNSVWTWIFFLVGVPVAAGVGVTVVVMRRDRDK